MKDKLWAPWRKKYILEAGSADKDTCFLCNKPDTPNKKDLVVATMNKAYVILNKFPYNNGHVMVAPYKHAAKFSDLEDDILNNVFKLVCLTQKAIELAYKPDGINIGANLGAGAGAGVAEHIHIHAVPRWFGDTNFMPVLSDVKVIPEHLFESYNILREAFNKLGL